METKRIDGPASGRDASRRAAPGPRRGRAWARAVWGGMLALHLWPLAQVGAGLLAGEGGWTALAMLLATQALFALKLADVRWLRLPSRKGAVVAFLVATCFAHPEVAFEELGHAAKSAAVVSLAAAPAVARARPKRWLTAWLDAASRGASVWRDTVGVLALRLRGPALAPVILQRSRRGRAPPVSSDL